MVAGREASRVRLGRTPTGAADLFVIGADGRTLRQQTHDRLVEHEPVWSPDGSEIAYVRQQAPSGPVGVPLRDDLMVLDLATGDTRQLTHDVYGKTTLSWSPDGLELAYEMHSHVRTSARVVDARTGEPVAGWLDGSYPFWQPDGASVAYVKAERERLSLLVARSDGSDARVLLRGARDIVLEGLAWSPNSRFIAFSYGGWSVDWTQLERVDVRTGRVRRLTQARSRCQGQWHEVPDTCRVDRYIDFGPSWSQDGSWIAFVRWRRGGRTPNPAIAIVDRDGGGVRLLPTRAFNSVMRRRAGDQSHECSPSCKQQVRILNPS